MKQLEQSRAERIFDAMQRRQLLNAVPLVTEEVHAARRAADFLFTAMRLGGLRVEDGTVVLVCLDKEGNPVTAGALSPENTDSCDLEILGKIGTQGLQPIGIGFAILDREHPGHLWMGVEAFEGAEHGRDFLFAAIKTIAARHKKGGSLPN